MSAVPRSLVRRFAVLLVLVGPVAAVAAADRAAADVRPEWVTSWAGPQQSTTTLPVSTAGVTLREPVWLTIGGDRMRVEFSNAMMNSTGPLTSMTVLQTHKGGSLR